MLSSRHSLTFSPSKRTTGLAPETAKIAIWRSGSTMMPASLTSERSGSAALPGDAFSAGRRVALNSGRSLAAAINPSIRGSSAGEGGGLSVSAAAVTDGSALFEG
jgi:hypothetical protein